MSALRGSERSAPSGVLEVGFLYVRNHSSTPGHLWSSETIKPTLAVVEGWGRWGAELGGIFPGVPRGHSPGDGRHMSPEALLTG